MSSLALTFRDKLIPWAQNSFEQRLIVAQAKMKQSPVPYGVGLTKKKVPGKRVLMRTRDNGSQRIIRARWPEAGLHELTVPKLVCVVKGITDFQAGEHVITCGEGQLILLPPGTPNTTGDRSHLEGEHRKTGSCDLLQLVVLRENIHCSTCYSRNELHQEDADASCYVYHPQAANLFNLFLDESLNNYEGRDILHSQLLSSFFILLWREIQAERFQKRLLVESESTFGASSMLQALNYIKANLHQQLTIETVARQMYMSPSQFTHSIRRETGYSFLQILTEYRLEQSKQLLVDTHWSIASIAKHVGFKSSTYFITLFSRREGCSPGKYRKEKKDSNQ
jgi:AraC-like DNA-binding protein